jgi:hypothetical protein
MISIKLIINNVKPKDSYIYKIYNDITIKPQDIEYPDITKIIMHNHLENNFHLSNKKALFYNIKNYMNLLNKDPFKIIPLTFHINCKKDLHDDLQF